MAERPKAGAVAPGIQRDEGTATAADEALTTRASPATATAADEAPIRRPLPAPRTLTRNELEALRSRLHKKFH